MPAGNTSGIPAASYAYATSAIDPDEDQIEYTFDWGDGTTSKSGLIDSGTSASANHTWSKAGTYQIRAQATDTRGASSPWSESLTVIINTPPSNPGRPSGPGSGQPGTSYTYASLGVDPDGDRIEFHNGLGRRNRLDHRFRGIGSISKRKSYLEQGRIIPDQDPGHRQPGRILAMVGASDRDH